MADPQLLDKCRALMTIRSTLGPAYETHKQTLMQQAIYGAPPAIAAGTLKSVCF